MKKPTKTKKPVKAKKSTKTKRMTKKPATYFAQSKRLGFRLLELADEALFVGLYTDDKTMEFVMPPLLKEQAEQAFKRVLAATHTEPVAQRFAVIIDRATRKPIGISGFKFLDDQHRHVEGGVLLHPSAHARRLATESSKALVAEMFKRHSIDEISAHVVKGHTIGEKFAAACGYSRGVDVEAVGVRPAGSSWSITRQSWVANLDK